ncbi:MAG TPA: SDR family NAD(P)-dependent oxidoreductase [Alphaproteobacteria bacterium]|nr:SDR family NAD(P)-dependent oxidoreductase [Alphaproteobacteria bacterium]
MKDLEGKVAFVTGGASGIGYGMARTFLKAGMKVVIADVNQAHLDEVREELQGSNAVHFIKVDVSNRDDVKHAADEAERVFGKVHVLCNNAGVSGGGSVDDGDFDDWDRVIGINFGGVVNGVKVFAERMIAHGEGGHIVNTSSMAGIVPLPQEGGAYTTSKFAVRGLTESLRLSMAPHNIGVSLLCPGLTATRILEDPTPENKKPLAREGDPDAMFNTMEGAMDPLEVGEVVLESIRRNEPYILPHGEFREEVRELFDDILNAFPVDQEADQKRLDFEERRRTMTDNLRKMMPRG